MHAIFKSLAFFAAPTTCHVCVRGIDFGMVITVTSPSGKTIPKISTNKKRFTKRCSGHTSITKKCRVAAGVSLFPMPCPPIIADYNQHQSADTNNMFVVVLAMRAQKWFSESHAPWLFFWFRRNVARLRQQQKNTGEKGDKRSTEALLQRRSKTTSVPINTIDTTSSRAAFFIFFFLNQIEACVRPGGEMAYATRIPGAKKRLHLSFQLLHSLGYCGAWIPPFLNGSMRDTHIILWTSRGSTLSCHTSYGNVFSKMESCARYGQVSDLDLDLAGMPHVCLRK